MTRILACIIYIYIGDNFATTRGRTNARSKDLIGQRRVDDSRVIRFNAYNAYNRGRREGREGSVFFSIISRCKSPRFHLGHVSPADYILTGQYIRIDNGTISLDICLSFFYLFSSIPFVPLFFFFPSPLFFSPFALVCFPVNRPCRRNFSNTGCIVRWFLAKTLTNYLLSLTLSSIYSSSLVSTSFQFYDFP